MNYPQTKPASSEESGQLGVLHLKRFWSKAMLRKNKGNGPPNDSKEWMLDNLLLNTLGLGLEPTLQYLYLHDSSFAEFENWILELTGGHLSQANIDQFNALVTGQPIISTDQEELPHPLDQKDLASWEENGYFILRNAVSKEDCEKAVKAIFEFLRIQPEDPATWYKPHPARQGIMVQLFHHPSLQKNRTSPKIKAAYEQLLGTKDIWVSTDRVSFNPPETKHWKFPGPNLHWDVSLNPPIPFGLQGLLYLVDTKANQGAFCLVPGFHRKIEDWLHNLPKGTNPREVDLSAQAVSLAAQAGDFIIWQQALPHGSGPNTAEFPRIVQYINYYSIDKMNQMEWR